LSARESVDDAIARTIKCGEQRSISAISQTHPNQTAGIARAGGKEEEIFVFADDNSFFHNRAAPNLKIVRLIESDFQNMHRVESLTADMNRQLQWKLIVNEQLHEV
jgi:hypothetical protein